MDYDISPYVKITDVSYDGAVTIKTVVSAENATYINPEYIIKALCKYLELDLSDPNTCLYTVLRTEIYKSNGEIFN